MAIASPGYDSTVPWCCLLTVTGVCVPSSCPHWNVQEESSSASSDLSCLLCFRVDSSIKCCPVSLWRGQNHCNILWLLLSHILPPAAPFTQACIFLSPPCSCPWCLLNCLEICYFQNFSWGFCRQELLLHTLNIWPIRSGSSGPIIFWLQLFLNGGAGFSDLK